MWIHNKWNLVTIPKWSEGQMLLSLSKGFVPITRIETGLIVSRVWNILQKEQHIMGWVIRKAHFNVPYILLCNNNNKPVDSRFSLEPICFKAHDIGFTIKCVPRISGFILWSGVIQLLPRVIKSVTQQNICLTVEDKVGVATEDHMRTVTGPRTIIWSVQKRRPEWD